MDTSNKNVQVAGGKTKGHKMSKKTSKNISKRSSKRSSKLSFMKGGARSARSRKASKKGIKKGGRHGKKSSRKGSKMSGGAKRRSKKSSRRSHKSRRMSGGAKRRSRKMKGGTRGSDAEYWVRPSSLTIEQFTQEMKKATNIDEVILIVNGLNDPGNITGRESTLNSLRKIKNSEAPWNNFTREQKIEAISIGSLSAKPPVPPGPYYITRCGGTRDRIIAMINKL
jgi:hypothetical protein